MEPQHIFILDGKWAGMSKYNVLYHADSADTIKAYLNIWQRGLHWYKNHSYEMCRYTDENGNKHTYRISERDLLTMADVTEILKRKAASEARRAAMA